VSLRGLLTPLAIRDECLVFLTLCAACVQGVIELLGSIRIMRPSSRFDKPTRIERQVVQQLAALRQVRTRVSR
jgi:hypothetical protein